MVGVQGNAGLRIALVNDVEFHHEVTLGLMAALQKHRERLTVMGVVWSQSFRAIGSLLCSEA